MQNGHSSTTITRDMDTVLLQIISLNTKEKHFLNFF